MGSVVGCGDVWQWWVEGAVFKEVDGGVLNLLVLEGRGADVLAALVPLQELHGGNLESVSVGADYDCVLIWFVYEYTTLGAGLVAEVEAKLVTSIEFPCPFVLFEGKA